MIEAPVRLPDPSPSLRRAFAERGFVRLRGVLDADEVAFWRRKVGDAVRGVNVDRDRVMVSDRYWQYVNAWCDDPEFERRLLAMDLPRVIAALLDVPCVRLWGTQSMVRPGYSSAGGFHVDMAGWPFNHPRGAVAWIALDD